jgi:NitT/TauT family transport system ATP-binding protein
LRVGIENLSFSFGGGPGRRCIFSDFSLDLSGMNPVVILGPSGCGKTTLLRLIAGLLRPDSGVITVENSAGSAGGAGVGAASFVFQEARLLSYLNALENVMLPVIKPLGRAKAEERARFFLEESSLGAYTHAYPCSLSGGQKQRVSIARAWAYPAPVILMDEPFQSLDIPLRIQLMDAVRHLLRAENRFVIAVTHDPREAIYLGRRIIVLGRPSGGVCTVVFDEEFNAPVESRAFVPENSMEEKLASCLIQTA